MPAPDALPAIRDLLSAFGDAIVATKDEEADVRRGSVYDQLGGIGAILLSREAQHDRDLFRALYFDTATGADLTDLVLRRFGIARVLDTYGTGTASLERPTAAAGGGTVWTGTRILVPDVAGASAAREYAVAADTVVGPNDLGATVAIRATQTGSGVAVSLVGEGVASLDDPLWDATWIVSAIQCGDGTDFEKAPAFRARVRSTELEQRVGYIQAMTDACVAQGAANVALFASSYGGDAADFGINACYVSEAGFTTSDRLIRACTVALEDVRVCGADLLVLPMTQAALRFDADVTLTDDPGSFNLGAVAEALVAALLGAFEGRASGYTYSIDALRGAMLQGSDAVQDVSVVSPPDGTSLLVGTPPNFPPVLTRYTLAANDIVLRFHAPS